MSGIENAPGFDGLTPHDQQVVRDYAASLRKGPRQPLNEKDAEIARLRGRIVLLEAVVHASRTYLANSTPVNANRLHEALRQAKNEE